MSVDFVHTVLEHVELGMWPELPPAQLARSPELVAGRSPRDALKYAPYGRSAAPYDEIGFRSLAATPVTGLFPLPVADRGRVSVLLWIITGSIRVAT